MDSVSGLLTVLLKGDNGEAYNISDNASDIMLKDLAAIVAGYSGKKLCLRYRILLKVLDIVKATKARLDSSKLKELGWTAKYDINMGIARTLDVLKEIN